MSRAYCLTCNEHVHETPSGTCPLGHPVAADGYGPEPWVGFAGDTETEVAEMQMHHLDTHGRPREHAGVGQHTNATPHVNGTLNGSANGSSNGHAGSLASSSVAFPSVNGSDRPATNGLASDDLTALLAEALRENDPPQPAPAPQDEAPAPVDEAPAWPDQAPAPLDEVSAPVDEAPAPVAPASQDDADWSELANLAAELHLDEEVATDDGPRPTDTPEPDPLFSASPSPAPVDDTPEAELSSDNIDDLLAELTGGTSDPSPPAGPAPVAPPPAVPPPAAAPPPPPPPTVPVDDTMAWDAPPPPLVDPVDETTAWDAPPPPDDVGSAPTAEPVDIWAEPTPEPVVEEPEPVDQPAAAPTVDLYNFTARGKRVGDAGSALPARKKKRGRKR